MEIREKTLENGEIVRLAVYGGVFSRFCEEFVFDETLPENTEQELLGMGIRAKVETKTDGTSIIYTQQLVPWNVSTEHLDALHDMAVEMFEEVFFEKLPNTPMSVESRWWIGAMATNGDNLMTELAQKIVAEG